MGELLMASSVVVFLWAAVGLVRPAWARLPGRPPAVGLWIVSLFLLGIGGALAPEPEGAGEVAESVPAPRESTNEQQEAVLGVPEWISGGTLHDASLGQWGEAAASDRLATAADFAAGLKSENEIAAMVAAEDGMAALRVDAAELVACVDEVAVGDAELRPSVRETAALCAILMGWEISPGTEGGFGNGTHLVGADIDPGTYRADAGAAGCYWERLSGLSGDIDDVIAEEFTEEGSAIVSIAPADRAFKSEGCGRWSPVE